MKKSAGILLYRRRESQLQVLLVHPGGPFWVRKDEGAWSIPKGELEEVEDPFAAALREFEEEIGYRPEGTFLELTPVKQSSGKTVIAWAVEGDCDPSQVRSNTFPMEWPRGSGKIREFPEIERAEWFSLEEAERKIVKGQAGLLRQLAAIKASPK